MNRELNKPRRVVARFCIETQTSESMVMMLDRGAPHQTCRPSMPEVTRGMKWVRYARAPLDSTLGCAENVPFEPCVATKIEFWMAGHC